MKYKIYKLVYNNEVIYVGYTKNSLKYRFYRKHPSVPIEIKQESSIELIEETDDKTREEYWRLYYIDLGCNLYNKRRGDGIYDKQRCLKWGSLRDNRRKNNDINDEKKLKWGTLRSFHKSQKNWN